MYYGMTEEETGYVIDAINAFNRRGETMFRFEKYEDSLEEQWDKFITENP